MFEGQLKQDRNAFVCSSLDMHNMPGTNNNFSPKFLRKYENLNNIISNAVKHYISDVKSADLPNEQEMY